MSDPSKLPSIDFYFDFISPYGYFAAMKIEALAEKYGHEVNWKSMLLGVSVLKKMGLKPLLSTPLKGPYVQKDVLRLATLYNLDFTFPTAGISSPLASARAFYWVKKQDPKLASQYAKLVYQTQWAQGKDIADHNLLAQLAGKVGLDGQKLKHEIDSDEIRDIVRKEVDESIKKGIFGSPTFMFDNEMIWGSDRLWMLEHLLKHGNFRAESIAS